MIRLILILSFFASFAQANQGKTFRFTADEARLEALLMYSCNESTDRSECQKNADLICKGFGQKTATDWGMMRSAAVNMDATQALTTDDYTYFVTCVR